MAVRLAQCRFEAVDILRQREEEFQRGRKGKWPGRRGERSEAEIGRSCRGWFAPRTQMEIRKPHPGDAEPTTGSNTEEEHTGHGNPLQRAGLTKTRNGKPARRTGVHAFKSEPPRSPLPRTVEPAGP